MNTYLESTQFSHCPGCGHGLILRKLAQSLEELKIDPLQVAVVTDIGCVGLADRYLKTHTVHTLHGRSTAIASGLKIAKDGDFYPIVFIGDGGATIGLLHLVEAARMNVNITVLLHNNFLYGMTGGQHSGLTPKGFRTRTTREGNPFSPMDICAILEASGASFLARTFAQDRDLTRLCGQAIKFPGFSLIEILELCTGYAVKYNQLTGRKLMEIAEKQGLKTGIIKNEIREPLSFESEFKPLNLFDKIELKYKHSLSEPLSVVVAGSAGEGVQFACSLLIQAGIASGLYGTQKNDYPVTVGSGFSLSELKFSPSEIGHPGAQEPDAIIITSEDGFKRVQGLIERTDAFLISDNSLKIRSKKCEFRHFRKYKNIQSGPTLSALSFLLRKKPFIPLESLLNTIGNEREILKEIVMKSFDDRWD